MFTIRTTQLMQSYNSFDSHTFFIILMFFCISCICTSAPSSKTTRKQRFEGEKHNIFLTYIIMENFAVKSVKVGRTAHLYRLPRMFLLTLSCTNSSPLQSDRYTRIFVLFHCTRPSLRFRLFSPTTSERSLCKNNTFLRTRWVLNVYIENITNLVDHRDSPKSGLSNIL